MSWLKSWWLEPFLTFLRDDEPTPAQALPQLRSLFVLGFTLQLGVAALVALVVRLLTGAPSGDATLIAQVLLVLSVLQGVPVTLLASPNVQDGGREAALSATIATAVLFAVPGWFAAFAWLVGVPTLYLFALGAVLMSYYAFGFLLVGRYARWVGTSSADPPSQQSQQSTS